MKELVLVLSINDIDSLGSVRNISYLQAAFQEENIWIRGIREIRKPDPKFKKLPSILTYIMNEEGNLFPVGKLTPVGKIPDLNWVSIPEFIKVEIPTSAIPGKTELAYKIKMVNAPEGKEGAALLTTLSLWKKFAESASEIRLTKLRFAVSENKEVLIVGSPLPSIPGKEYWLKDHLLLPSGYDFEIPLISTLVSIKVNAAKDALLLFNEKGEYQRIPYNCFIQSTRSSVRLTEVSL